MRLISRFKNIFTLFCFLGIVTGCAQFKPLTEAGADKQSRIAPADLMTPCDTLPQFSGSNTTPSDLVGYNISIMQAYGKCSMKLKNLQDWISGNS